MSNDAALGLPFNIASYATLTHLVANLLDYEVGDLICNLGDVHLYENQIEGVREMLTRVPLPLPTLEVTRPDDATTPRDYALYTAEHFKLNDYQYHPSIPFQVAV